MLRYRSKFPPKSEGDIAPTELFSVGRDLLHNYIGGIIKNKGHQPLAINSVADHIHIFLRMKPKESISDLVRDIKANSSKHINESSWIRGRFSWQEGFGAFSYGYSQIDSVIKYIRNQEKHHEKKTFADEYLELLKKFHVDYDTKYVFD